MGGGVFLGIDHGGSTTTAMVLDPATGERVAASVSMPKSTPRPGWVEHDPDDFLRTSLEAAGRALLSAKRDWRDVAGVGIANQGETSMAWSRHGGALGPAISWEDRRTVEICEHLATQGVDALIRERTGILLDPYFSASKFRWLLDNVADAAGAAADGSLRLGGTDSYVLDQLTGGAVHATDPATASRTALMNIRNLDWDDDLLAAFGLERRFLPLMAPTCGNYGMISADMIGVAGVPIAADTVDAHAALFAQGCRDSGVVKATYGTGAFIEANTGSTMMEPDGQLPVFVAWQLAGQTDFTIEGGVFAVGSAIDWAVRAKLLPSAAQSAELAGSVCDSAGVVFVPSLTGLSAPHWKPGARGCIFGLGLDTGPAHLARALLDGIAFQCAEVVEAIDSRVGGVVRELRADGGPTMNRYLMQRQADLLDIPVAVSLEPDMTALGAALLAAVGTGALTLDEVGRMQPERRLYEPSMSTDEREWLWHGWRKAVATVCERASE